MSDLVNENQETQIGENDTKESITTEENMIESDNVSENETSTDVKKPLKERFTKKKMVVSAIIVVAVIIAAIVLIPSKFDRVKNQCGDIAAPMARGKGYFTIDTIPDIYDNLDDFKKSYMLIGYEEKALKAIKLANEKLGFNGSLYKRMMETNALMGRQSDETSKYKVSWTYHPDDGLEVTYEKK